MRRLFKCNDRNIRELHHVVLCACWTTDPASDNKGSQRRALFIYNRGKLVAGLWACLKYVS